MAHPVQHPSMPTSVNYVPDYQALINQDPAYAQLQQFLSAQGIQDAAQRQAATQQALIQYGAIPDFSSVASQLGLSPDALAMLQGDIDPNAAALAQGNTAAGLSTQARLQQGQHQAIMSLRNALAAHGALSSGDDAYRTNLQDQSYAQSQSDALNALLQAIGGYQGTYLDAHRAAQEKLNQGVQDAMAFESGLPQNQGFHLKYDSKTGTYKDASGNHYKVKANGDGSWTLTGPTGGVYTLGANGQLTSGTGTQPSTNPQQPPYGGNPQGTPADWNIPGHNPQPPATGGNPQQPPYGGTPPNQQPPGAPPFVGNPQQPPSPYVGNPQQGGGGVAPVTPPFVGNPQQPPGTTTGGNPVVGPIPYSGGGQTPPGGIPGPVVDAILGGGGNQHGVLNPPPTHGILNPPPTHGIWPWLAQGGGGTNGPPATHGSLAYGGSGGQLPPSPTIHGVLNPPPTHSPWPFRTGGQRPPRRKPPIAI